MLKWLETTISDNLFANKGIFELAEILKESRADKCLLVLIDGYLRDLQYEIEEEEWHFLDVTAEDTKEVS